MQIESLSTENFKKLGTQFFEFTSGVNFIYGENGAGKSTLLRGIATALFGVQMLPGHSDHVATFGQKTWKLSLEFTHKGESYRLDRSKSTASICKGGELVANGNTPVTKYIEDLLGMAAKDFNLLIHSRQGETNYVLNYGGTALQRKIEEFSGVEVVEKVASLAAGLGRDLGIQIDTQGLSVLTEEEKARYFKEKEQAEKLLKDASASLFKLAEVVEPTAPEISTAQAARQRSDYLNSVRELEQFHESKCQVEEDLAALEPVAEPQEPEQSKKNLKEAQQELKDLRKCNQDIQLLAAKKESVGGQLKEAAKPELSVEALQGHRITTAESKRLTQQQIITAETEIAHLRSHLKDATCSVCGSELKEVDENAVNEKIQALETDIIYNKKAVQDMEEQESEFRRMESEWVEVQRQEELQKQYDSFNIPEELPEDNLQAIIANLRNDITQYEDKLETYQSFLSRQKRLTARLQGLKEPEVLVLVEQSFVDSVEQAWDQYRSQLTQVETLQLQRTNLEKDIGQAEGILSDVARHLQKDKEKREALAALTDEAETAKDLNKYLRGRRGEYLTQVWDGIMFHAGEFLRKSTKGWLEDVCIEDGKFLYKEEGAWIPTVELSGAQESFVGTALRVGISKSLYRNDMFLIFDEPTDGMKEENARNLIAELAGTAGQVFIITHKETDQALADNLVEIV